MTVYCWCGLVGSLDYAELQRTNCSYLQYLLDSLLNDSVLYEVVVQEMLQDVAVNFVANLRIIDTTAISCDKSGTGYSFETRIVIMCRGCLMDMRNSLQDISSAINDL